MKSAFIECLEGRRLFSAGESTVLETLVKEPDFNGKFKTFSSDKHKINAAASFILHYLKDTNPTVPEAVHRGAQPDPISATFRLIIAEPTDVFASFPTTYTFSLNAKHPLNLFSIKQTDGQGDTMLFTGTLALKTKSISGKLQVKGPNRAESYTYKVVGP